MQYYQVNKFFRSHTLRHVEFMLTYHFFHVQDKICILLLKSKLNSTFEHILSAFLHINYMNHEITFLF